MFKKKSLGRHLNVGVNIGMLKNTKLKLNFSIDAELWGQKRRTHNFSQKTRSFRRPRLKLEENNKRDI